jgi:hypothetical protein
VAAVEAILKRCTHQSLLLTYSLPNFVPGTRTCSWPSWPSGTAA